MDTPSSKFSPTFCFPRTARLTKPEQFNRVFKQKNQIIRRKGCRLLVLKNRMPAPRLGLVVPKKMVPKAHQRNRIKRATREAFRRRRRLLGGVDIICQIIDRRPVDEYLAALDSAMQELVELADLE